MKKIFTLIAAAMAVLTVSAQDWNATNSGSLPKGTTILDNDYVTIVTGVQDSETALIEDQTGNPAPQTYAGFTFTKYVNIRVTDAPAADNDYEGTAYSDATPLGISLIVTAKKNTDVTLYYKHGDGKQLSCVDQGTGKAVSIVETAVENVESYYTGVVKFTAGNIYTIYAKGGTTGLNGISTAEPAKEEEIENGTAVIVTFPMDNPDEITNSVNVNNTITSANVTLGSGLSYQGTLSWSDITFTKLQPTASDKGDNSYSSATSMQKYIDFQITPSNKYQITKVEFDVIKIGTGDPNIFVDLVDSEGKATTIGDNLPIRRNNDTQDAIRQSIEAKSKISDQPVSLRIYAGKLANNKQVGIANVVITGLIAGEVTGISSVNAVEAAQDGAIYNLAGQKVDAGFKGIVIKNGKKVVMK